MFLQTCFNIDLEYFSICYARYFYDYIFDDESFFPKVNCEILICSHVAAVNELA